ncbi:site-specific integrase [Brucella sp. C7-11G]
MELKAPGLKRRPNTDGTVRYYWVASAVSKHAKEYSQKTVQVHGTPEEIAHRCRLLTSELKLWLSNRGLGTKPIFDGTLKSLIAVYRKTPESPYHQLKFNTVEMYDRNLDLLERTVGSRFLTRLSGLDFQRWYNKFKEPSVEGGPERKRTAYQAMQILRVIVKFGIVANITECTRLAVVLEQMRFQVPPARTEHITFEQVQAICTKAIDQGRTSIAIAQVLQFELTLRQIDVIGQWEPLEEGDEGHGIVSGHRKRERWTGGLTWGHIDVDGVLSKVTTKTGQIAEHDTNAYPYLRSILDLIPQGKRIGPMVIDESTGLPYRDRRRFSRIWRAIANECGVSPDVWNRDSRAGGVTEGSDAGANIEHLRHHANHANIATTARYNRNTIEKTRTVAELRVAHRTPKNATGTNE